MSIAFSTLFDPSRLSDLANPNFGVPIVPSIVHDDVATPCDACNVVHEPLAVGADSALYPWLSKADEHESAMRIADAVGRGDARRARRACDEAYLSGRVAAYESDGRVSPPASFGREERDAFFRGEGDVRIEENERLLRLEAEIEMGRGEMELAAVWA